MSSTYGEALKLSIFGQSHGTAIGMTMDGFPAGFTVDMDSLYSFLGRRAPGNGAYATPRKEDDKPVFLSGLVDNVTCGAPITAIISNTNTRSADYSEFKDCPRPGHADFTAQIKYKGFQDSAGGGHFSGRLTAPLCIAGAICKQWLADKNIHIGAHIASIGNIRDAILDPVSPDFSKIGEAFPVLDPQAGIQMQEAIQAVKKNGDSIGGVVSCAVTGIPTGIGQPMFDGVESKLAHILYGIPAVKGVEFGSGFYGSTLCGSENNDPFTMQDGRVVTLTNHAGGILGGITTGMPILFQVAFKPTASIAAPQQSVCLPTGQVQTLRISGRHDPCIVPRAVPVVEAAAAFALTDMILKEGHSYEY